MIDRTYSWLSLLRSSSAFDIPHELLVTLRLKEASQLQPDSNNDILTSKKDTSGGDGEDTKDSKTASSSCALCSANFPDIEEQRRHVKSDWHGYNLKQKLRGHKPVTEVEFDKLVEDLNESLSGSDSSDSEEDDDQKGFTLTTLLKKQARLGHPEAEPFDDFFSPKPKQRGAGKPPLIWFSSSLLPSKTSLGVYRALFTPTEQEQEPDTVQVLRNKQLTPVPSKPPANASNGMPLPPTTTSPQIFLCMVGGGHFAGMIVSLAPRLGKKSTGAEERQAMIITHKTFHRYTTRRKQGGAQSSNDSAKGAAHSAGASIRRYNEAALESEIRALLTEWKDLISKSQLIFVRATGSSNRRTLFGPYDGQVLHHHDPRNRGFPFSTRRATQAELMRAFVELTRVKISEVDEAALVASQQQPPITSPSPKAPPSQPSKPQPTKKDDAALLHTSQIQALIRRSRAPALLAYLSANSLPASFPFYPSTAQPHHHAPVPLHLAASSNSPACILALLTKVGADPTLRNGEGKTAFELAGDRATRDAFRVARSELGEEAWKWEDAHIPLPMMKEEMEKRNAREKAEAEKAEAERRKGEEERLKTVAAAKAIAMEGGKKTSGRSLGAVEKSGAEKREEEARGLTPELRMRLERERRARAAEERMRGGGLGAGGAGR